MTYNGDPTNFEVVINFTAPFYYDPSKGNLLLDVRNFEGGTEVPSVDQQLDGTIASDDPVSRVFNMATPTRPAPGRVAASIRRTPTGSSRVSIP